MNANVPPHLQNVELINPPKVIVDFCKTFGVNNVYFIDDERHSNSLRAFNDIYINTRGTYWANYISKPWGAQTLGESIFLRILHEIGHVIHKHPGKAQSRLSGLLIERKLDFWETAFTEYEGEAWSFAFEYRRDNPIEYADLSAICESWCREHKYTNRDWVFSREAQWKRISGESLSASVDTVPAWVKSKYDYIFE